MKYYIYFAWVHEIMAGSLVLAESMFTCDSFLGHNNMDTVDKKKITRFLFTY